MSDFRLKVFCCVARNKSFTRAARELFISQPAVTNNINELERQYSVKLFDRTGGKIRLTDAGQVLLDHSSRILDEYNRLEYAMSRINNSHSGKVSIGASTTIAQYILPGILAGFTSRYPKIEVVLLNGNSRDIEQALINHEIDLGLVEGTAHSIGLHYEPFLEDELVTVVSTTSTLPDEITPGELQRTPLVIRESGSGTLDVIEEALSRCQISLTDMNIRIRLGSTEAIKGFLRNSDCAGIVSIYSISEELKRGLLRICDVSGITFSRNFYFVSTSGQDSPAASGFKDFVKKSLISSGYRA